MKSKQKRITPLQLQAMRDIKRANSTDAGHQTTNALLRQEWIRLGVGYGTWELTAAGLERLKIHDDYQEHKVHRR